MKQNNWEKIEEDFDKVFIMPPYFNPTPKEPIYDLEVRREEVKQFLRKTIIDILDEAVGEEKPSTFQNIPNNIDAHKHQIGMRDGYNQKRSEIIKLKERLK